MTDRPTSDVDPGRRARATLRAARTAAVEEPETRPAALVRCALVAKLAADLDDAVLVRLAARHAAEHARILAGLDVGPAAALPNGEELLERRLPPSQVPQ